MDRELTEQSAPGLRSLLLRLARREDEMAAREAAASPYWAPCPATVVGRRAAASVLRDEAERLPYGAA